MWYIAAIIGIFYLLNRSSGNAQVLPVQQPSNYVLQGIAGAAIYVPTANGAPGRLVIGPTGSYGTLGVSQSGITDNIYIASVPNPAAAVVDPVQPILGVIDYRRQQGTLPQLGTDAAPDYQPAGRNMY